jgi:hypothetical protein
MASETSTGTQIRWQRGLQPSQEEFNLQEGKASARLRRQMPIINVKPDEVLEVPAIALGRTDPGRTKLPVAAVLGVDSMKVVLFTL